MRDYAAVFEKTSTGWSAYCPDLPGLGVAGPTYEVTEQLLREGIAFHIAGMIADGDPIPDPRHASPECRFRPEIKSDEREYPEA